MTIHEEQLAAWERWKAGDRDRAGKQFVEWYASLIGKWSGRFAVISQNDCKDDFEQIGRIALCRALDTFDPEKAKLPHWIRLWIKAQCTERLSQNNGAFSIPKTSKERTLQRGFGSDCGTMLEAGFSWGEIRETLAEKYGMHARDMDALYSMRHGRTAIADSFDEDAGGCSLVDEDPVGVDALSRSRAREGIDGLFDAAGLNGRERVCIRARFHEGDQIPFETLGIQFGVTRERVRQVVRDGLIKLTDAAKEQGLCFEDLW